MKEFITKKFGYTYSDKIYSNVYKRRDELVEKFLGLNIKEQKVLRDKILPVISLYEIMLEDKDYKPFAIQFIREYLIEYRNKKTINKLKNIETFPFSNLRFKAFLNRFAKSGFYTCVLDMTEDGFNIDIEVSLWNKVVIDEGHDELKDFFFESMDYAFAKLTKYKYSRSKLKNNHVLIKFQRI